MAERYSMLESHEWSAVWWRPESPDRQVAGRVIVNEDGIELRGIGPSLSHRTNSNAPFEHFQIDGVLSNGKHFSVTSCLQTTEDFGLSRGPFELRLRGSQLHIGAHTTGELRTKKTFSGSPMLDPWLGVSTVAVQPQFDPAGKCTGVVIHSGTPLRIQAVALGKDVRAEIWRSKEVTTRQMAPLKQVVYEFGELLIEFETAQDLNTTLDHHTWFHALVEFLTGEISPVDHLSFEIEPDARISVLSGIRRDFRRSVRSEAHPAHFLASYHDVHKHGGLASPAHTWFAKQDQFRVPIDLLREVLSGSAPIEFKVLAIAQALEGFHRRAFPNESKYVDDETFNTVREALAGAIPASVTGAFRQALKKRLVHGNESSLRKRVKHLIDLAPEAMKPAFGKKPRRWADTFVDLRNNLTHLPEDYDGNTPPSAFNELLRGALLLQAHVMLALGLPSDFVGDAMKRTRTWDQLATAGVVPSRHSAG